MKFVPHRDSPSFPVQTVLSYGSKIIDAVKSLPGDLYKQIKQIIKNIPQTLGECLSTLSVELGNAFNQIPALNLPIDVKQTVAELSDAPNDGHVGPAFVIPTLLKNVILLKPVDIIKLVDTLKVFIDVGEHIPDFKGFSNILSKCELCWPF